MELDISADVVMENQNTAEGAKRRPRRATDQRRSRKKDTPQQAGAGLTEPAAPVPEVPSNPASPAPVARAKRTRSPARKARAAGKKPASHPTISVEETRTAPDTAYADSQQATVVKVVSAKGGRSVEPTSISEQPAKKRSRRGRRRKTDAPAPSATPVSETSFTAEARQVEVADMPRSTTAVPKAPAQETPPDRLEEPRERRRRRGRRGRGQPARESTQAGAAERPPQASSPQKSAARPSDVDLFDFDVDEAILDEMPAEASVELEGAEDLEEAEPSPPPVVGSRQMMINVSAGTECRIAILHDNRLEEFFIERESTQSHVGNIYKGRVTNVEPSIQAAFVDFGLEKNGFLHISDVQPQYFPNHSGEPEDVGRKIPRHHRPPIQRCFRRGQEVIVQITKEGVGTKGPTLTSYLSIPGRFLVMMPGMSRHGVSRKIEDEEHRREMRDLLGQLELPTGMGFILRTAGLGRNKRELQRDLNYLVRLWKTVVERIKRLPTPAELYRESDLVTRTIRDIYTAEFDRIVIDDPTVAKKVGEFLQIAVPRSKTVVEHYADREPLFHRFGIEAELERINMRHVPLSSGGSLVIDSTEAMVAIDVNSGRFRTPADAEETALRINIEAAEEIARQLRLRDLGGLIVCDFIDMRHDRNKRKVEQSLRDALKKHKERARILRMSAFGLIEMTRQRQGPSLHRNLYTDCPECHGTGHVKLPESVTLDAMRMIQFAAHHEQVQKIVLSLSSEVAFRLLNQNRGFICQVEKETSKTIVIHGNAAFTADQMEIACEDARGRPVTISAAAPTQGNGKIGGKN